MKFGTLFAPILATGSAHMNSRDTRCHITHTKPSYTPQVVNMSTKHLNLDATRAVALALYRMGSPAAAAAPANYGTDKMADLQAIIATHLGVDSFTGNSGSLKILAGKLGIPGCSDLALAPLIEAIGVKVTEVLAAKDEPPTVHVIRVGPLDADMSCIPIPLGTAIPALTPGHLNASMGMSQTQANFNLLVSPTLTSGISVEDFQSRYDALIASGLTPQELTILSRAKASHALAYAHHVNSRKITVAKMAGAAKGQISMEQALLDATKMTGRLNDLILAASDQAGFEIPIDMSDPDEIEKFVRDQADHACANSCTKEEAAANAAMEESIKALEAMLLQ